MRFCLAAAAIALLPAAGLAQALPDPKLTPGYSSTDSPAAVCAPGYAARQRLWSSDRGLYWARRREVMAEYRIPWERRGDYELDDLVPLCLGGRQVLQNLWPQPKAEAALKDRAETRICRAVCSGRTGLDEARGLFLRDWRRALSREEAAAPADRPR